jgi:hypothetical protein
VIRDGPLILKKGFKRNIIEKIIPHDIHSILRVKRNFSSLILHHPTLVALGILEPLHNTV